MSNMGFNYMTFITEVRAKCYKHFTWIAEEEGKNFTIALRAIHESPA